MSDHMSVTDALAQRRTIRAFKPDPVPAETIREIVDLARQSASNSNTQPWHIAVVSGDARDRLEKALLDAITSGSKPHPEWPAGGVGLKGDYKQRQIDCAMGYYDTVGVSRDDKAARQKLLLRNWSFFGAPHAAFLSMPKTMHRANAIDIGIFLQSLMLLMTERGIASCPQGALAAYPDPVRAVVDVPDDNGIIVGLSFGYADTKAKANDVQMPREPLDRIASFTS